MIRCFGSPAQAVRQRVVESGSKIQAEDGIANAVEIIERIEGIKQ